MVAGCCVWAVANNFRNGNNINFCKRIKHLSRGNCIGTSVGLSIALSPRTTSSSGTSEGINGRVGCKSDNHDIWMILLLVVGLS